MTSTPHEPTSDPAIAPGGEPGEPDLDPSQPGEPVTHELPGEA